MNIETLRKWIAERDSYRILETIDVHTGERTVLKEIDYVIEAPNWTQEAQDQTARGQKDFSIRHQLTANEIKRMEEVYVPRTIRGHS